MSARGQGQTRNHRHQQSREKQRHPHAHFMRRFRSQKDQLTVHVKCIPISFYHRDTESAEKRYLDLKSKYKSLNFFSFYSVSSVPLW